MSWWRSLADLDRWAKDHPTHKAIFGQAMKYLSTMGPAARLRLYHEVTVAAADDQHFEYFGCHPGTGLLRVLSGHRGRIGNHCGQARVIFSDRNSRGDMP